MTDAEVVAAGGNLATVRLSFRRFPGLWLAGDTMARWVGLAEAAAHDALCLAELRTEMRDSLNWYVTQMAQQGMELPFGWPLGTTASSAPLRESDCRRVSVPSVFNGGVVTAANVFVLLERWLSGTQVGIAVRDAGSGASVAAVTPAEALYVVASSDVSEIVITEIGGADPIVRVLATEAGWVVDTWIEGPEAELKRVLLAADRDEE